MVEERKLSDSGVVQFLERVYCVWKDEWSMQAKIESCLWLCMNGLRYILD